MVGEEIFDRDGVLVGEKKADAMSEKTETRCSGPSRFTLGRLRAVKSATLSENPL